MDVDDSCTLTEHDDESSTVSCRGAAVVLPERTTAPLLLSEGDGGAITVNRQVERVSVGTATDDVGAFAVRRSLFLAFSVTF